jgi:excisionase family DNA binding protein
MKNLMGTNTERFSTAIDEDAVAHSDLDGLLTVDELAGLLKVPKSWIYEHTRKRGNERLPHRKLGKYLRFFEHEVRHFLDAKSAKHIA